MGLGCFEGVPEGTPVDPFVGTKEGVPVGCPVSMLGEELGLLVVGLELGSPLGG